MKKKKKKNTRARKVLAKPEVLGWKTSDDDEIEVRRWRGRTEIHSVEVLEPDFPLFGTYRVRSASGSSYEVEIRDLKNRDNSCGCVDHRVNALGTCKHIEGVLAALKRKAGARAFKAAAERGSPRVEIFLARDGASCPAVRWPETKAEAKAGSKARSWLSPFLRRNGALKPGAADIAALWDAGRSVPRNVRISRHFGPWLGREKRFAARAHAREAFLAEIEAGDATWDVVKLPLLPYQKEGVLHLLFGERVLLADEMGLGKTIQAIAACELLARRKGIGRVLVVSPASVKAEWEEQIARFTDRSSRFVVGSRAERLKLYAEPAFFTLVNYEQVVNDVEDINGILKPDVVVLDEAQRIKNWQTKTARKVKSLRSPFAFVLTGTPLENRIDETYSIVQYLDPEIFGPLFRFNRDFYDLDERGRPVGYRNLGEMHKRLSGVMLRRRKRDVENDLPGRAVKTFFVPMAEEQASRYADYESRARKLAAIAERRPLTKEEFEFLQKWLACMRMICDTPAILDPTCRVSPKLEELEGILEELLEEDDRKIVVFSEWVRMLELVRELAREMGFDCAWHTGQVPQLRRRAEIARFREDPACRLFLSSDAGAVGLNLQMASCVINLDLPWNPAKLEQRIARVWRKGQTRAVTVVNLVTENSIEHSILHLLAHKQTLADGVLDGAGDFSAIKMPSGRAALIERMQAMLGPAPPIRMLSPEEALVEDIKARLGDSLVLAEMRADRMVAVIDGDEASIAAERLRLAARAGAVSVELIGRNAWEAMQRLVETGVLQFVGGAARLLHRAAPPADTDIALRAAE
jgi:superfamily II DNA or RNA helicase